MLACAALRLATRRGPSASDTRALDAFLWVTGAAIAAQLVPLPRPSIDRLAPHMRDVESQLAVDYLTRSASDHLRSRALSIEPASTLYALGLFVASVLLFWACRWILARGGLRSVIRGIATIGLLASLLAIVQRATSYGVIYWWWRPEQTGANPFGPLVNRNHFATWMLMAIPLVVGYLVGRSRRPPDPTRPRDWVTRTVSLTDPMGAWLIAATAVMTLAVFISASRSGLFSLFAAALLGAALTWRRMPRQGLGILGLLIIVSVALVATRADLRQVLLRFDQTLSGRDSGRLVIWRETVPVVQSFWLTGTGIGTYETAMLVYQQTNRADEYFNQAHNHYLQVAAEGGVLVAAPVLLTLVALAALIRRRLAQETSWTYWVRAGAATGLCAVAIQSIWETGLRIPANTLLCAVMSGIAVHPVRQHSEPVKKLR